MRFVPYAIALAVVLASTQTLAATPQGKHVKTTGDLVVLCDVSRDNPIYEAAMGFCLGYIDAVIDYHTALTAGPEYDPIVCPQREVTREEVVMVLLDWSKRNTSHLKSETPVHGLIRAASEKWPCAGQ